MPISRRLIPILAAVAAGGIVALALGQTASAHITIAEPEHVAGAFTLLTFGVPHGCEGSPTTEVRIQMPESIPQVTPTRNPNWDVEKVMEALPEPIEAGHGEEITERVAEVVYTAKTPLPDGYRDAFVLSLQVPADAAGSDHLLPDDPDVRGGRVGVDRDPGGRPGRRGAGAAGPEHPRRRGGAGGRDGPRDRGRRRGVDRHR